MQPIFNVRCRKVGGIWFLRIGRFQFSFCICRGYPGRYPFPEADRRPNPPRVHRHPCGGRSIEVYHDT